MSTAATGALEIQNLFEDTEGFISLDILCHFSYQFSVFYTFLWVLNSKHCSLDGPSTQAIFLPQEARA